jgi:hypothetical protein
MKQQWQLNDLVDLEYFFQKDANQPLDTLHQRDRAIYLYHIAPSLQTKGDFAASNRRAAIYHWLNQRRESERTKEPDAFLPGDAFSEIHAVFSRLILFIGFLTGLGLTFSLLSYQGKAPLNVASYWGILVLSQVLLLLILAILSMLRFRRRLLKKNPLIISILGRLLITSVLKAKTGLLKPFSAAQKNSFKTAIGIGRRQKTIYGSVFFWPLFLLIQQFGIGFNSGVLFATLIRVLSSDLAFGWQSTIQVSSHAVYQIVRLIALPWSWFIAPPMAHPTLAQIIGSKLILKDGIYHLVTRDLVSWWPFLCFSVLVYGMLPRILLFALAVFMRKRKLGQLRFDHFDADRLMYRLETPLIKTTARPLRPEKFLVGAENAIRQTESVPSISSITSGSSLLALVPDDISNRCVQAEFSRLIFEQFGYNLAQILDVSMDITSDGNVFEHLASTKWDDGQPKILILQEAWQPPIREIMLFIEKARQILGERAKIIVALVGLPVNDTIFTPVKQQDWEVWEQRINVLGDPYLRLERLINE